MGSFSGASLLGRCGRSRGHSLLRSSCRALAPGGCGEGTGVFECHVCRYLDKTVFWENLKDVRWVMLQEGGVEKLKVVVVSEQKLDGLLNQPALRIFDL